MDSNLPHYLAEVRARLEAATPGPWDYAHGYVEAENCADYIVEGPDAINDDDNGDFIAHAPADIAKLLAMLEVAREALEKISQEGSELYEGTQEQVPRDHLAALIALDRFHAQIALAKLEEMGK